MLAMGSLGFSPFCLCICLSHFYYLQCTDYFHHEPGLFDSVKGSKNVRYYHKRRLTSGGDGCPETDDRREDQH